MQNGHKKVCPYRDIKPAVNRMRVGQQGGVQSQEEGGEESDDDEESDSDARRNARGGRCMTALWLRVHIAHCISAFGGEVLGCTQGKGWLSAGWEGCQIAGTIQLYRT